MHCTSCNYTILYVHIKSPQSQDQSCFFAETARSDSRAWRSWQNSDEQVPPDISSPTCNWKVKSEDVLRSCTIGPKPSRQHHAEILFVTPHMNLEVTLSTILRGQTVWFTRKFAISLDSLPISALTCYITSSDSSVSAECRRPQGHKAPGQSEGHICRIQSFTLGMRKIRSQLTTTWRNSAFLPLHKPP